MTSSPKASSTTQEEEKLIGAEVRAEVRGLPYLPINESRRPVDPNAKPLLRGWIHAGMLPLALASGIVLIVLAHGAVAKWSSVVFMVSSLLLFGNSALYHRFNWGPKMKVLLKRIDHSNIFLLIAGTYTPISLLLLPPDKSIVLMSVIWGTAVVGILFRVFWVTAPRWLYVPIYIVMGWAAVIYLGDLFAANVAAMVLVLVGGVAYTVGAVFYGLKKPNPFPRVFGFHEIFHSLTAIAFICHTVAIYLVALNPPIF